MLPILIELGPIRIYSYGFFMFIGLFLGLFWWWKMGRDEHFDEVALFDSAFVSMFIYFIIGRITYVMTYWNGSSLSQTMALFARPGIVPWVGIVGVFLFLSIFSRIRRWNVWRVYDVLVVALSVVLTFASFGGFLNGSNPGKEFKTLSVLYIGVENPVFPVDAIGVIWFFVTFIIVSRVRKNFRFYLWYKAEKGNTKDGLASLVFGVSVGLYYMIRGVVDDGALLVSRISYMSVLGLVLFLVSIAMIVKFSGKSFASNLGIVRRVGRAQRSRSRSLDWKQNGKVGK